MELTLELFFGLIVGLGGLCFGIYKYHSDLRHQTKQRDFEAYHRLIKELVALEEGERPYIDRQTAVVFELRHFPRYKEHSIRMLAHLRDNWGNSKLPEASKNRLLNEMKITEDVLKGQDMKPSQNNHSLAYIIALLIAVGGGIWSVFISDWAAFSRSGSLIVVSAILLEYWPYIRTNDAGEMPFYHTQPTHDSIRHGAILVCIGTLIWGFGDLINCV